MILGTPSRPGLRIMVASKPVDFRKGMDSLAALVAQALASDPFTGDVFIFVTDARAPPRGAVVRRVRL
jgi:transposase